MITASIVVYNSPVAQLVKAVECIRRSAVERIYIIYNGSAERAHFYSGIEGTLFVRVDNNGFGAGHNHAIRKAIEAGSRYHLVMNADVCWQGDAITPLVQQLEADGDIAMIAPDVRYPDGSMQHTCRMLPTPYISFARRFLPRVFTERINRRYLLRNLSHKSPANVPYILGCFMLLRVDALRQAGAFDERFFMYPEDIDLTRRLHARWKTIYYPFVSIIHEHQQESRKSLRMLRIHTVNMIRYYNKWGWLFDPERRRFNRRLPH